MCPQPAQHDRPLWPSAYLLLARVLSWLALLARSDTAKDDRPPLRPEQPAPSGVDVKDLRPLRGRPFGSILDPDASPRRAQLQAENPKKKDHPARTGLTGPAPSGMTGQGVHRSIGRVNRDRQPAARGHRAGRVQHVADQGRQGEVRLGDRYPARLGCGGHVDGELAEGVLRRAGSGFLRPVGFQKSACDRDLQRSAFPGGQA
jgi:hypothetical protein